MSLFAWNAKVISWLLSCYECVFVGHHHVCPYLPRLTTVGKSCALPLLHCLMMIAPSWILSKYFGLLCEVVGWELGSLAGMLKRILHKHAILSPHQNTIFALLDMLEMILWISRTIIVWGFWITGNPLFASAFTMYGTNSLYVSFLLRFADVLSLLVWYRTVKFFYGLCSDR